MKAKTISSRPTVAAKNAAPRISANKLAEYIEANPARRKRIVQDAKNPANFIVTRYKEAREAMKNYLSGDMSEEQVLGLIEGINKKDAETEFQDQDNKLSVLLLEALLDADISIFEDYTISAPPENVHLNISGVRISVNPDLVLEKSIGSVTQIGTIKLHVSKLNALSDESQKLVGVLLYQYATDILLVDGQVANNKLCFSFDVFANAIQCCPSSFKNRLNKIEVACEEIAMWWDKL